MNVKTNEILIDDQNIGDGNIMAMILSHNLDNEHDNDDDDDKDILLLVSE